MKPSIVLFVSAYYLISTGMTVVAQAPPDQKSATPKFVAPADVAKSLGYEPTSIKVMKNFPERVKGKRVALLNSEFMGLSDSFLSELPGVTLESNGLQSLLDLRQKEKWVGFWLRDSESEFFHYCYARKETHGDQLLALKRGEPLHCFGRVIQLERSGGNVGFIVEVILPAKREGVPGAKVDELLAKLRKVDPPKQADPKGAGAWDGLDPAVKAAIVKAVNDYNKDAHKWNTATTRRERVGLSIKMILHRKIFEANGLKSFSIRDDPDLELDYLTDIRAFWRDPSGN